MGDQLIAKIGGIILSLLIIYFIRSRRELTPEKIDQLERLRDQPKNNDTLILYLRDFVVDGIRSAQVKVGYFTSSFLDTNFETELSLIVSKVGRFIAVGVPSPSGDVGADRYIVENEEWKDRVTDLMEKSSMILIRPSLSVGLIWELEQLIKKGYLNKTVICYHKRQDGRYNYKLFRDVTKHFIKLPSSFLASKYMWFDDKNKLHRSSILEGIPLYENLLFEERDRLRQKLLAKKNNQESIISDSLNDPKTSIWVTILIILSFITILGVVFYLKWG